MEIIQKKKYKIYKTLFIFSNIWNINKYNIFNSFLIITVMYINIGWNYNNNSFLSTWNFNIISDMINPRYSKIFLCLSISEYFILIKVFEIIVSLFLFSISTATTVSLYKRASVLQMDKFENEIMKKEKKQKIMI